MITDTRRYYHILCDFALLLLQQMSQLFRVIFDDNDYEGIHVFCIRCETNKDQNFQVWILCNDCNDTTEVFFHIIGQKCRHCRSYNTRTIAPPVLPQEWPKRPLFVSYYKIGWFIYLYIFYIRYTCGKKNYNLKLLDRWFWSPREALFSANSSSTCVDWSSPC